MEKKIEKKLKQIEKLLDNTVKELELNRDRGKIIILETINKYNNIWPDKTNNTHSGGKE